MRLRRVSQKPFCNVFFKLRKSRVCNAENPCVTQHESPSKKAGQILASGARYCAFQHVADLFTGPRRLSMWLYVAILMFCMPVIEWISASEEFRPENCPSPSGYAYKCDRWKMLALFSWTEILAHSFLDLYKIGYYSKIPPSESPQVWFPESTSPAVTFATWMTSVWVRVDAVHGGKELQLLSRSEVGYIWVLVQKAAPTGCYVLPTATGGT